MNYKVILNICNIFLYFHVGRSSSTSGFYTDDLDQILDKFEIVYPEKVSKDGSFVSYFLPHYYNIESLENRPRRTSGQSSNALKDQIHFFVPIDGEVYQLELSPSWNFIAPSLIVERRDLRDVQNINKAKMKKISQRQCHYSGKIIHKPNSSVAISTCNGLAGYIRVPTGDEYFIEPVKDSVPSHDKEHPHIIYKRSGTKVKSGGSNCLTKGSAREALAERLQWEAMFGDQVRRELSGLNVNELMRDQVQKPVAHNFETILPKSNTFDQDAQPDKFLSSNTYGSFHPGDNRNNKVPQFNINQANPIEEPYLSKQSFTSYKTQFDEPFNSRDLERSKQIQFSNQYNKYNKNLHSGLLKNNKWRNKREVWNTGNILLEPAKNVFDSRDEQIVVKPSDQNINLKLTNDFQKYFDNNAVKTLNSSTFTKPEKGSLKADEKLIASVLESVAKDMNRCKVKKEVSINSVAGRMALENENKEDYRKPISNSLSGVHSLNILSRSDGNNHNSLSMDKKPFDLPDDVNMQRAEVKSVPSCSQNVIQIQMPDESVSDIITNSKQIGLKNIEEKELNLKNQPFQTSEENVNKDSLKIKTEQTFDKEHNMHPLTLPNQQHEKYSVETNINVKKKRNVTAQAIAKPDQKIENTVSKLNKNDLFCKGKHCLDIKPVVLNETKGAELDIKTNKAAESINGESMFKVLEKRQVWPDDCSAPTTVEPNLLCFDLFNKMFNIELMVTVDYKVVKMHEDDDIENFILTVINMVSTNFFDNTIGINLSVSLIRLILLTTCIKELDSDRFNPDELLENFCTWQVLINPGSDDHPHHHDLAIFVTRMDKCQGQILGVAYMTSLCRPDKSCIVCVDEGLLLANTITHQIGHALGAEHDESDSSGCSSMSPDGNLFFMASTISETSSAWSVCSKDAIIQFLKIQGSWCLTDVPVDRQFNFPLILPGQVYSAAQQCKLNFHMIALPCSIGPFCDKLYCQVTDKLCATKGDPPADGTFCAADMWCFHKQCVHVGRRPGAINGEWGFWTEWSLCTRSCGGGVSTSYRICNNPRPQNGGRYCIGNRIRHRMCLTTPCVGFTDSFRDLQCKKTEDKPFRGRLHNWFQYHSFFTNIECALVCQNTKGEVVMRSPVVADGTPCKPGTRNVCIQGLCRNVGCDFVIDSNAREDACGVCQGNGTECTIIQGVFDEPATGKGLIEFLRIPKGSGMIFVREIAPSKNIIVVSGAINHVFYLNGLGTEDSMPGDITLGEIHGVYEIRSNMERIFARGPTTEELVFYALFKEPNKGIHYQFAVPQMDPNYAARYLWQYVDWDPCSDPCSGGSQRAHAKCVEDRAGVVDDQFCIESSRPMDIIRPCNDFPCQPKWWVSVWSDCICTGSSSVMFRSVLCMRATDESGTRAEIVKESDCAAHKKPVTQKPCNATLPDEYECPSKRSVSDDYAFDRAHKDFTRAVNPSVAYSALPLSSTSLDTNSPNNIDLRNTKESLSKVKDQPNQKVNAESVSKVQSKVLDDETPSKLENEAPVVTSKEASNLKHDEIPKISQKELSEVHNEIFPNEEAINDMKLIHNSEQADELRAGKNNQGCAQTKESCETTCPTPSEETTKISTCRQTCPVQSHRKTTCCRQPPKIFIEFPQETTTLRPASIKVDNLNLNEYALTVVPLDIQPHGMNGMNKDKLPMSDPEYIFLGNLGQFGVADANNATILTGQEALDFLDYTKSNVSEETNSCHEN